MRRLRIVRRKDCHTAMSISNAPNPSTPTDNALAGKPIPVIPTSPPWTGRTKRTVAIVVLVLVGLVFFEIADVLPLIVIGLILSFLLNPLTTWLERRILRRIPGARSWAILLTFIVVILIFLLLILVVLPVIFSQLNDFAANLPAQLETLQTRLTEILSRPVFINGQPVYVDGRPLIPFDQLQSIFGTPEDVVQPENIDVIGIVRGLLSTVTGPTFSFIGRAFSALISVILLLTMMFYLLKDGNRFIESIIGTVSPDYQIDTRRLLVELGKVWNAYLRGQLILSTFVGTVVFIVATILGVPNAPVLGLISFTLEFVPNIGPLIALVPAALLALVSQSNTIPSLSGVGFALVVVIVWTIIQNVQAILITPRVMGNSLNLHPIVVILGVLLGASIGGALGVILAAPTIASLRLFGQYVYWKLMDKPVFPDPPITGAKTAPRRGLFGLFGRGSIPIPAVKPASSPSIVVDSSNTI